MIYFSEHAKEKFEVLKRLGFIVTERQVLEAVQHPEIIDYSRLPQLIAQRKIDSRHVMRVVYKIVQMDIKIITFYPGRAKQYEKE